MDDLDNHEVRLRVLKKWLQHHKVLQLIVKFNIFELFEQFWKHAWSDRYDDSIALIWSSIQELIIKFSTRFEANETWTNNTCLQLFYWPIPIKELAWVMSKSNQIWQTWSNTKQLQRHNAEAGQFIFFSSSGGESSLSFSLNSSKLQNTFFFLPKSERQTEIYHVWSVALLPFLLTISTANVLFQPCDFYSDVAWRLSWDLLPKFSFMCRILACINCKTCSNWHYRPLNL